MYCTAMTQAGRATQDIGLDEYNVVITGGVIITYSLILLTYSRIWQNNETLTHNKSEGCATCSAETYV